jgi:phage gp29-like protein
MLLDRWGRPVRRAALTEPVAAPTLGGVRSPISGYPGDGLDPVRLATILREADAGELLRYLELAETVEERDPHYLGVLATRKRSVAQLDLKVEAASDGDADVAIADAIRDWLTLDDLAAALFDMLDCVGKGYSFTEIIWERTEGQWRPAQLVLRDPRWFRFDRTDLSTPRMIAEDGTEAPLPPYRFVFARMQAKSGLPGRSGLARLAAWGWMFKAYTQRDWAIFTQTYGQPLRLGRYGPGASEQDRETLFRAVANIAGDCAAIVPQDMPIEFIQPQSLAGSAELYERRADWLDRQISKAVLGQTTTTDAISGGHAVSREHRLVQEDIERADARALAAVLNRDLIRPWVDLEWGPQARYPRVSLVRPEAEDIERLSRTLAALVPLGLRVQASEVRDRLGLAEPEDGAEVLAPQAAPQTAPRPAPTPPSEASQTPLEVQSPDPAGAMASLNATSGVFEGGSGVRGMVTAPRAEGPPAALPAAPGAVPLLTARAAAETAPAMAAMLARIEAMVAAAGSLPELAEMLRAGFAEVDAAELAAVLGQALLAAHLAGRAAVLADGDGT